MSQISAIGTGHNLLGSSFPKPCKRDKRKNFIFLTEPIINSDVWHKPDFEKIIFQSWIAVPIMDAVVRYKFYFSCTVRTPYICTDGTAVFLFSQKLKSKAGKGCAFSAVIQFRLCSFLAYRSQKHSFWMRSLHTKCANLKGLGISQQAKLSKCVHVCTACQRIKSWEIRYGSPRFLDITVCYII